MVDPGLVEVIQAELLRCDGQLSGTLNTAEHVATAVEEYLGPWLDPYTRSDFRES